MISHYCWKENLQNFLLKLLADVGIMIELRYRNPHNQLEIMAKLQNDCDCTNLFLESMKFAKYFTEFTITSRVRYCSLLTFWHKKVKTSWLIHKDKSIEHTNIIHNMCTAHMYYISYIPLIFDTWSFVISIRCKI